MSEMGFLQRILDHKRVEVQRQEQKVARKKLEEQLAGAPEVRPFAAALRHAGRLGLIAEIKKQSPAKGMLLPGLDAVPLAQLYASNGADAISVLTDVRFWGGSLQYLKAIRAALPAGPPLLRKDVIIDPYQVVEARVYGADAILLIVAALSDEQLATLYGLALQLEMEVLVEVHSADEARRAAQLAPPLLGINNRDLDTFTIDIETTRRVIEVLPRGYRPVLVSESGLGGSDWHDAERLLAWGADAILVGEAIVTAQDPAARVRALVGQSN
ncbi:MAG: indole-3-glycerol phosphate synthase TrpC [Herpetosiphon sp.]